MIQLEALTLGYGQQILLDHVSANLDGGGLIALLGRNGSGKSTLLRATAGLGNNQVRANITGGERPRRVATRGTGSYRQFRHDRKSTDS